MAPDPATTLRILWDIPVEQIDRDLASAAENLEQIHSEIKAYLELPSKSRTPEQAARHYHNMMLQAHAASHLQNISQDQALYYSVVSRT